MIRYRHLARSNSLILKHIVAVYSYIIIFFTHLVVYVDLKLPKVSYIPIVTID